jgi:hypothetical protein
MAKKKTKPVSQKNVKKSTASKAANTAKGAKKQEKKLVATASKKASPKASDAKAKASSKPAPAPKKALKKEKIKKTKGGREEIELEDDFEPADFDGSEIAEYEDELKAVEEDDTVEAEGDAWTEETAEKESDEVILTDAEGNRYCRARDCDQIASVDAYCRYHYLLFWKKIQVRKKILQDGKLERYVEELTSRYPDKFLEMIRRDLRTEKDFLGAIQELEIDEAGLENEFEEDTQTYIDEVRGMGDSPAVDEEEF